jgi:hypothetical protein
MKCRILILLITTIAIICSCNHTGSRFTYTKYQKIHQPELPLILIGDTITEPKLNDIRFISMIDGTCWTCLDNYSKLKEVFKQIEKSGFDVSNLVYIRALDYEEVSVTLALFQFFYPVYIDRYWNIYALNDLDANTECFLVDNDNRLLWAGTIPRSTSQLESFLRIIHKNSN